MSDVGVLVAFGVFMGCVSAACFILARWNELRSTTGSWEFSVFLLRFTAFAATLVALIAIFNFNVMATFMVIAAWVIYFFVRRRMAREALVWILALTTQRGLPLAPSIQAFALECTGGYRWRVLRLAQRLRAGMSLSAALAKDQGVLGGLLTHDGAAAVCVGVACGDLPNSLLEAARVSTVRRPIWNEIGAKICYLVQIGVIFLVIFTFFMYFIAPQFIKIFEDFDVDLPPLTILIIRVTIFVGTYFWPFFLLFLLTVPLALFIGALIQWEIPGLGGFRRNLHKPSLLRALAGVVERNQPLQVAMAALAESYPSRGTRRRLQLVREAQAMGESDWQAFARQGLLTPADADVLNAAACVGNLPWAMRTLAEGSERRQGYRIQFAMQLLWPLAILAVGSLVGVMVVGWFMPIAAMIRSLI
jgi:type II secretory pathway component PulF